jgi:hypothetical protein
MRIEIIVGRTMGEVIEKLAKKRFSFPQSIITEQVHKTTYLYYSGSGSIQGSIPLGEILLTEKGNVLFKEYFVI